MQDLRFWFYCRKSTDSKRTQLLSLDTQDQWRLREVSLHGYNIIKEYTEAESASKASWRPEFYQMIEDIHRGEINAIITYEIDRLARNFTENSIIQTLSQEWKIKVIHTATGTFYPDDILHLGMKSLFSVYETHQMKKKAMDGINNWLRKWQYMGSVQYWYNSVNKKLIINKDEAFFVRKIFELRADGMTFQDILDTVNSLWFKHRERTTRDGVSMRNHKLTKSTLERILSNPTYYGMIRYKEELYQGIHDPIISKELFDSVNSSKKRYWKKSDITPLKGKVYFNGFPLTVSLIKKKFVYFHKHSDKKWEKIWINQNKIIEYFDKNIELYKMPDKYKEEFLGYVRDEYEKWKEDVGMIRKNLNKKHGEYLKELDGLIWMRTRDEISQDLFLPRKNEIINKIHDIESQLKKLTGENDELGGVASETVELLTNIDQYWKKWDIAKRLLWIANTVVELKFDTEKRLYIEEIPTIKAFREHNMNKWWTIRHRRHNLYSFLMKNQKELKKYISQI